MNGSYVFFVLCYRSQLKLNLTLTFLLQPFIHSTISVLNCINPIQVKLYVGNLSFDTTQESVQRLFEQYGTVTDCFMPTDRETSKVRGFCFVTMPAAVAEDACNKLNGYELDGRTLRVNEAQPKGMSGGGRGGGFGGGYQDGGGYGGSYGSGGGGTCLVF